MQFFMRLRLLLLYYAYSSFQSKFIICLKGWVDIHRYQNSPQMFLQIARDVILLFTLSL